MKPIERELRQVLDAVSPGLLPGDIHAVLDMLDAGEYGVALEVLCVQLVERDARCEIEIARTIRRLSEMMELDSSYWQMVQQLL